ncbi:hypothetical protein [Streptomyces sp. HNM0574]|uniref:hypothetical protein n=1 Tax=Streptomyces sp. HNM0574 TaxID=2714954 RepID=UPI001469EEAB|nr:hypothetical protein [Streptomyces sp. HNM0574]NLU66871.1 hypothetical protein [Streptomyces sp. HNM0574]
MNSTAQPTRYDRWMFGTMNDPRVTKVHATRGRRRALVVAHIALTAVMVTGFVALFVTEGRWWLAALLAPMVAWIPVTGVLNASTRGLLELRSRMLDERQLAERGEVYTRAHRLTLRGMLLALAGLWAAGLAGLTADGMLAPLGAAAFALLVLHWLAPLWIAALRAAPDAELHAGDEEFDDAG